MDDFNREMRERQRKDLIAKLWHILVILLGAWVIVEIL